MDGHSPVLRKSALPVTEQEREEQLCSRTPGDLLAEVPGQAASQGLSFPIGKAVKMVSNPIDFRCFSGPEC